MFEIPIRKGYSVKEADIVKLNQLKNCQSLQLITLVRDEILPCSKCGYILLVDDFFKKRGSATCPGCGKSLFRGKTQSFQQRISKINFDQILEHTDRSLKELFPAGDVTFDKAGRYWILKRNGKIINILIYGISSSASFFSITENEGVVLYLDGEDIRPKINNFNKSRFVYFNNSMFKNPDAVCELIDSLDHSHTLKYFELKEQFEVFISKSAPQYFENEFAPQFIEAIKTNNTKLKILYSRLQSVKDTIINTKFVNIGGPGQSDFFLIDLFDYLQDGLKPEKYGEMKCYTKSSFTMEDFGKALAHAASHDTLSIVSTDDIHPFVWSKIFEFRNQERYYKHVIIDKDLMLFLIHNLELTDLIK